MATIHRHGRGLKPITARAHLDAELLHDSIEGTECAEDVVVVPVYPHGQVCGLVVVDVRQLTCEACTTGYNFSSTLDALKSRQTQYK